MHAACARTQSPCPIAAEETMHRLLKRALGGALLLSAVAGAAWAQDKFAKCPDPEAARKHVQECLAANPYNTQEVCEERALEKLCRKK
jgi:hypothetical protein